MDVADWLRTLGLQQYEATFREHDITAAVLPNLSAEDLKDIGIAVVGHRHRLLDAVAALRAPHQVTQSAAERRQLTVMFCDVMDFTPLSSRLDPEDLSAVIREYQSRVATNIARFGGFIARYVGDGVLIYFGWPEAHEADAERAVRAALAVIAAIDQMSIRSERLRIRIGIATGLVVIGAPIGTGEARQQTAIGETPNLAARLQALAGADGVVIDQTTRRQLRGLFDCHDLGRLELKGFAEPVPAWRVLGERMIDSRFAAFHSGALSPLIGRNAELDLLMGCWQRAKAGEGRALLVSGEAGIGKSRLIAAFENRLKDDAPARSRYFCSPDHTDTPLYPMIAALQHEARFARSDTDADRLRKLRSVLVSNTPESADIALIADMLSIRLDDRPPILDASPQARKEATFAALIAHLQSLPGCVRCSQFSRTRTGRTRARSSCSMPRYTH
jgi:class 3 adenylate cyclase